jgi:hypothetical protein
VSDQASNAAPTEGEITGIEPDEAAIVFGPDGITLLMPSGFDRSSDTPVPAHVMAATEVLLRAQEEGIEALATALQARMKQ